MPSSEIMNQLVESLKKKEYSEKVIEIVKETILIAEENISRPRSGKIKLEVVKEVDKIYKNHEK